jgi:FkbM family methyltransferase
MRVFRQLRLHGKLRTGDRLTSKGVEPEIDFDAARRRAKKLVQRLPALTRQFNSSSRLRMAICLLALHLKRSTKMMQGQARGQRDDELTFTQDLFANLTCATRYAANVIFNPAIYIYEGIRLPLRATPELQRHRRHIYKGLYERQEMETIRHLLRPDDIVLELGTGCGIISTFIAQRLSDSRRLHTFEANPRLLKTIDAVTSANAVSPNVVNAAVGLRDGEAEFFFDEDFLASAAYDLGRNTTKARVQVVGFSEALARIRPTFIVFDIEGAERDVLSVPLPQEVRVLCGELHPQIIGDDATSDLISNIISSGFNYLIDRSAGRAVAFARP